MRYEQINHGDEEQQSTKVYTERYLLSVSDEQRNICSYFTTLLEVVEGMDVIPFYDPMPLKTKEEVLEEIRRRKEFHDREAKILYHLYDICRRGPEPVVPEIQLVNHLPGESLETTDNEVISVDSSDDSKATFDTQPK
jgi:hypothetical protein